MKKLSKVYKKGFTMIELLVVIAIIGILASLALISFSRSQKQARDAQRKSDLKQYQNALELFANKNNGLFPSYLTAADLNNVCNTKDLASYCPEDPRVSEAGQLDYRYISNGTGSDDATKYVLWGELESISTYWVLCSTGAVGEAGSQPTGGDCPL